MTAIRVVVLCIAAAILCSTLRIQRPEIAAVVSLAVGIGSFLLIWSTAAGIADEVRGFMSAVQADTQTMQIVLKSAGITMISELGVQICTDAGESALAGRIRMATRVVLLSMALPMLSDALSELGSLLASYA